MSFKNRLVPSGTCVALLSKMNQLEWVPSNEAARPSDRIIIVTWDNSQHCQTHYKVDIETLVAQAAVEFGESEVHIKYNHPPQI